MPLVEVDKICTGYIKYKNEVTKIRAKWLTRKIKYKLSR